MPRECFDKEGIIHGSYGMVQSSPLLRRLELVLFFGTLLFYAANVLVMKRSDMIWDEPRYVWYAKNLTHGMYNTEEKTDIINGPGYPLVLAPMIALQVPLLGQRMLNALFIALAAWFTFRAVLPYAGKWWAFGVALAAVVHPVMIRLVPWLMTEALTSCCIAGFAWAFSAALRSEKWRWGAIVAAGMAFGWLTLTRVFFGNVLLVVLVLLTLLLVWKSQRESVLRALSVMAVSLVICIPWLAHTYRKTGDILCWSTNGGELLYWATSTRPGENGHWFSDEDAQIVSENIANGHRDFYRKYYFLPVPEREAALKQAAMANLRANPRGVFYNWICNMGRLTFDFPRSHLPREFVTTILLVVNGPILLVVLLTLRVGWRNRHTVPVEVLLLLMVAAVYLGGASLLPGQPRYLVVILPWIGVVVACVLHRGFKREATNPIML